MINIPGVCTQDILLVMLLVSLVLGMVTVGYFLFRLYRMRSHLKSLKDLKHFFNGTADIAQLSELRAQLKTHLSSKYTKTVTKAWTMHCQRYYHYT